MKKTIHTLLFLFGTSSLFAQKPLAALFTEQATITDKGREIESVSVLVGLDGSVVTVQQDGAKEMFKVTSVLKGSFSFIAVTAEGEFSFLVTPEGNLEGVIWKQKPGNPTPKIWWRCATGKTKSS